jgi:hypothetical protein
MYVAAGAKKVITSKRRARFYDEFLGLAGVLRALSGGIDPASIPSSA